MILSHPIKTIQIPSSSTAFLNSDLKKRSLAKTEGNVSRQPLPSSMSPHTISRRCTSPVDSQFRYRGVAATVTIYTLQVPPLQTGSQQSPGYDISPQSLHYHLNMTDKFASGVVLSEMPGPVVRKPLVRPSQPLGKSACLRSDESKKLLNSDRLGCKSPR